MDAKKEIKTSLLDVLFCGKGQDEVERIIAGPGIYM